MFAFLFDEDHPESEGIFGAQFASGIVAAIERMRPVPSTRICVGGLTHNLLVYEVDRVTLAKTSMGSGPERSQHSLPNYDLRLAIICDLAETLSSGASSFTEEEILNHLARKNIWVIFTPHLSEHAATEVHSAIRDFGPYLGLASVDPGNPLHRRLFFESLFDDKFIGPNGLTFCCDVDDENSPFANEYGSTKSPVFLDPDKFAAHAPKLRTLAANSERGKLTAQRIARNDPGHRARVAQQLIQLDIKEITSPIDFSARKPKSGIEFEFDSRKFTDYLFNVEHPDGGSKANFFIDTLGIHADDWRFLADQIIQAAQLGGLYRLKLSKYGASHGALAFVTGRNGKSAVIETGWLLSEDGPAQFITAYPDQEARSVGLTQVFGRVPPLDITGNGRWAAIHDLADAAGQQAGKIANPRPMVLERFGTIWEGECGFGWVQLPDGRKSFSKWIVSAKHGYQGRPGVRIYSRMETQSIVKNEAYAHGYASVLRANGIECSVGSRLD